MNELWENIVARREEFLLELIANRTNESVILDFKRKQNAATPQLDKGDKQYLGEALSGFSNAQGGLLIWGIDARRGQDGIDCAQHPPYPISNILLFENNVRSLIPNYLSPQNNEVEVLAIQAA